MKNIHRAYILILIIIILLSTLKIFMWHKDNSIIDDELEIIESLVNVDEIIDENDITNTNSNSNYIVDFNFSKLKDINSDIRGWLQVPSTTINYPFVQHKDNDYYLNHTFYKEKSSAGWIFLDYRNNIDNFDDNTIIYGHNRKNKAMFGSLNEIVNSDWLSNEDNHIIKLSTEKYNTLWQIFSIYKINTTSDYLTINFDDKDEYKVFINMILKRSIYDFDVEVSPADKILTLSTCSGSLQRLVLHAKLIKMQSK